jgi:hypothetical protein
MKAGKATSGDGLRLMDVMHQAALDARKERLDSAMEYGVAAFILVSFVGLNAGYWLYRLPPNADKRKELR